MLPEVSAVVPAACLSPHPPGLLSRTQRGGVTEAGAMGSGEENTHPGPSRVLSQLHLLVGLRPQTWPLRALVSSAVSGVGDSSFAVHACRLSEHRL